MPRQTRLTCLPLVGLGHQQVEPVRDVGGGRSELRRVVHHHGVAEPRAPRLRGGRRGVRRHLGCSRVHEILLGRE